MKSIAILDYGINNLYSIINAIKVLGFHAQVTNEKKKILNSDGLIFPGVGSFPSAMRNIINNKIDKTIYDFEKTGKPILAICLGFQMLFSKSFELEIETPGLEILPGEIIRLPETIVKKIPHVGWNRVLPIKKNDFINDNEAFYFVHSYYAELKDNSFLLSNTNYNDKIFCSSILKKNILGCQFHPEKSGKVGLKLIHNFFTNV